MLFQEFKVLQVLFFFFFFKLVSEVAFEVSTFLPAFLGFFPQVPSPPSYLEGTAKSLTFNPFIS